ncbi:MAG TPA: ABC transporter ATP-binding protein [Conexibacter sp.]|nr:ABC transporter ATP-binding protein [Conexibacter sp.]
MDQRSLAGVTAASSASSAATIIRVEEIVKRFGDVAALKGVSCEIPDGAFFSLLGPSGCGKTTLLKILAGLEAPTSGDVLLDGRSINGLPPERRPFNLVFQSYALFPHLTVAQNLAFGPRRAVGARRRGAGRELDREITEMLALVELQGFERRMPSEVSGGQQQRVALARALINRPRLLLLDEPMAALDRHVRVAVREQLVRIHAELGTTFVLVTHDQEEALSMSTAVALMDHGTMVQVADPETLYQRPGSLFAARFVGAGSLLPVTVTARREDRVVAQIAGFETTPWCADAVPGEPALLLLRPQELRLVPVGEGNLAGAVSTATFLGDCNEVVVATAMGDVRVRTRHAVALGEQVGIAWDPRDGVAVAG